MFHRITHLGGETCVTGSCHLLQINGLNLMVVCGLAQGMDPIVKIENWPISPKEIDYLFLTHAHIDHIGRVPELIQKGFKEEILSSHPTKALLQPMLVDTMHFTLEEYSAHADQKGLVDWISSMPDKPGAIKPVHGNPRAQSALTDRLRWRGYTVALVLSTWKW